MTERISEEVTPLGPGGKRVQLSELLRKLQAAEGLGSLSYAQDRMWFLEQLSEEPGLYNVPVALRLKGHLDVKLLERSLREIVRRHESLRTVFEQGDEGVRRIIREEADLPLPMEHVEDNIAGLEQKLKDEVRRPFDLERGPLVRVRLFRERDDAHVLVMTLHHIISDGWSIGLIIGELKGLYEGYLEGEPDPLPPVCTQYGEYIQWQRRWLQGGVAERQIAYWRERLGGTLPVVEIPADRARPAVQTYRGDTHHLHLDTEIRARLLRLAREERATLYMVLLAAFLVLLRRYTRLDEIVVGSPVANRRRVDDEDVVGLFVNTLVMRCDVGGGADFRQVLRTIRKETLNAFEHQDAPFEKVVEDLNPERNLSRPPLFQVMFSMVTTPALPESLGPMRCVVHNIDTRTSKFDLTLDLSDMAAGLSGRWEYNSDLFDRETIRRMVGHYHTLLGAIVADPSVSVDRLAILPADEKKELEQFWAGPGLSGAQNSCLHTLFDEQVARTPATTAVFDGRDEITYLELKRRSDLVARRLLVQGMEPETFVGVCMERTADMVAVLLGIMKAGGAYVPLDPAYPPQRLAFLLSDTGASVVIAHARHAGLLAGRDARIVTIESILSDDEPAPPGNATTRVRPDNLAYLIYTSGSTGIPKGVAIEHRNAVVLVRWALEVFTPEELAGVLASTSINFDLSVFELFVPLSSGGTVVLVPNALELLRLPAGGRVTLINTVPSAARELIDAGGIPPSVQTVNLAGEPLPQAMVDDLYRLSHIRKVYDLYGPSEDTTYSTCALRQPGGRATIGRPLAGKYVCILDSTMEPVPVGVPGEIYIGGDGLARGYLNRAELTAERFVRNPRPEIPGARLYRTGDLARFLPDGSIELSGRIDEQVKLRGFRIEPGEIQSVLGLHPAVKDNAVVVKDRAAGERMLVAYVVPQGAVGVAGAADDADRRAGLRAELRQWLQSRIPDYLVPASIQILPALPRTPNGKLDRNALPAPSEQDGSTGSPDNAPRDPLEMQLVLLWEKIFGRKGIGVRDNFFDLGGHSLLAVRMFSQVEKLTGKNLPLVTLFQAPTIEQLASLLRQEGWEPPWSSLVAIRPGGSKPPLYGVHGVGGNILEFSDLTKYLGPDQPLYGLQAQGLDGKKPLHTSVEEMAEYYIKEVREFQPEGPYHLAGSSFGGMVAYEMARRLVAAGERVGLVALFDTMAPGYPKFLPATTAWKRRVHGWRFRLDLHWSNIRVARGKEKWEYVWEKTERLGKEIRNQVKKRRKRIRNRIRRLFFPKGIRTVPRGGWEAASRYRPPPYGGSVTLFRAAQQPYGIIEDRTNGWGSLALGGVEVVDVPGHHGSIMRAPRARALAASLTAALTKAREMTLSPEPVRVPGDRSERKQTTSNRDTFEPQGEAS